MNLIVFPVFRLVREPYVHPLDSESIGKLLIPSNSVWARCFFDWLSFVLIWAYFRFFVWFEVQNVIRLTPNLSEYHERCQRQLLFKSQLVLYSWASWFGRCFWLFVSSICYLFGRLIANTFLVRFSEILLFRDSFDYYYYSTSWVFCVEPECISGSPFGLRARC